MTETELEELSEKIQSSLLQIFSNNERVGMIVAGANIEDLLKTILTNSLKPIPKKDKGLFDYPGILSTFSAKISMCYSLGLIDDDTYKILDDIRDIRNKSAHNVILNLEAGNSIYDRLRNVEKTFNKSKTFTDFLGKLKQGKVPDLKAILLAATFTIVLRLEVASRAVTLVKIDKPIDIFI